MSHLPERRQPDDLPPNTTPGAPSAGSSSPASGSVASGARGRLTADRLLARAEDDLLLARIRARDEGALGELYDRWGGPVHALVRQMLGDAAEAEEVVEDAFWQVWRQAESYDPARGAVSTWLLIIARSRALDRLRARARRREEALPADELTAAAGADEGDPADHAAASDEGRLVRGALAALPREQSEVLTLAYFGGLSQSEIATRLGQPLGTIKTRTRLALQKLREQLAHLRDTSR